ncbi:GNAT family N-acetyltransferase [Nocardioides sp.]|uniref:GNAT family N-acetyltransferase n=1 Tax=Nocardioides sp. TaxID=35761 RepID=UPI0026190572|nr:GNAT family N-acetyltransferase [Nocardioides sp.]
MTTTELPGLIFHTLTAEDGDGDRAALLRGWNEALLRGFHEGRLSEDHERHWLEATRADGIRMTGAWPSSVAVGDAAMPVATYASWGGELNVGAGHRVPLHMISDVTVSPTHRRRGLLRRLMVDDLRRAQQQGLALAALTASEGAIYGRFGFGPATRLRVVEVDVTSRFALRQPPVGDGSLELVEPEAAWETMRAVMERHCSATRGAVPWPAFYEPIMSGRYDFDAGGPNKKSRVVVHLDAHGTADGFAVYEHAGQVEGRGTVDAKALVGLTDAAHLALWRFLADVDLTERVRFRRHREVDPLDWALVDHRVVRTTSAYDLLWLRVLDVVAALEARPWYGDGTVVLGVEDSLGLTDGRWRVSVSEGRADVAPTDEPAEVRLSAETLGALYLGGIDVATLTAAGRVAGEDGALEQWSAMADGGPAPYCATGF